MSVTASTATAGSTSLRQLLADRASAAEITRTLDALSPEERVEAALAVTGKWVGRLYEAMEGSPLSSLDELAPPAETGVIIYEGRNSLPLFSRFQKRFTRMGSSIVGYNHQTMSFVTGPGYFVVKPPSGTAPAPEELYFDYTEPPPGEPAGWPAYKPNTAGFSRAVYADMKDYMRRVARGVIVGKAYKKGIDQGAYFSLSRAV
ncbi:hypothetical protein [Chondromyces apiculatus]|nr:hypothetical protein [Chondromyces apiculatus]